MINRDGSGYIIGDTLGSEKVLNSGDSLKSLNGKYEAKMQ